MQQKTILVTLDVSARDTFTIYIRYVSINLNEFYLRSVLFHSHLQSILILNKSHHGVLCINKKSEIYVRYMSDNHCDKIYR